MSVMGGKDDMPQPEWEIGVEGSKGAYIGIPQWKVYYVAPPGVHKTKEIIVKEETKEQMPAPEFTEREWSLIRNCIEYANGEPAGLPGHNLMLIIAKLSYYVPVSTR